MPKAAAPTTEQALALAQLHGMRPLVAQCHLGLGKLYRRIGKTEHARENLTTATTMYREMDMGSLARAGADAEIDDVDRVFALPLQNSTSVRARDSE